MKQVQVLLSSYNGEKYIREQIDSILAQEGVCVDLLIRDDGSKDTTKDILQEYEKEHTNIHVRYDKNEGVIKSFFTLINEADTKQNYFAFADQDDVWLPEKLQRAIQLMEQIPGDGPKVYCSRQQLADENLQLMPSALQYENVRPEFGNALVENMCTGCVCVFNREMLLLLQGKTPEFTIMHDFWVYLAGTCFGTVVYDQESYILYRQHSNNTLGASGSLLENYRRRAKNFKKQRGQLTRQAEEFLRLYGEKMPLEKKQLAQEFVQAKRNRKTGRQLLKAGRVFRQRKSDDIIMRILLRCGLL